MKIWWKTTAIVAVAFVLIAKESAFAQPTLIGEPNIPWTNLFARHSDWSGGDGSLSVPLNGQDWIGGVNPRGTLWLFGDSFIGDVDQNGIRLPGSVMINSAAGWIPQPWPIYDSWRSFWGADSTSEVPQSLFIPDTPNSQPGDFYWISEGIVYGDSLYIPAFLLYRSGNWVARRGMTLLTVPMDARPPFYSDFCGQRDLPNYVPANNEHGALLPWVTWMPNTESAGTPFPDGYIYCYGYEELQFNKRMFAARVPEEDFQDLTAWRYWDGSNWVPGILNAVGITGRLSSIFSVTPLLDGRYLLVFQLDTISRYVAIRVGQTPVGPWSDPYVVYDCPQVDSLNGSILVYNAKAHPHLSTPDQLLVNYDLNCLDPYYLFNYAAVGRPRFITLSLQEMMCLFDERQLMEAPPMEETLTQFERNFPELCQGMRGAEIYDPALMIKSLTAVSR